MLVCSSSRTRLKSDLFTLRFNIQLWPRHFNLVALLAHTLITNIVALILVFLFVLFNLQVAINESGSELILSNRGCQQL